MGGLLHQCTCGKHNHYPNDTLFFDKKGKLQSTKRLICVCGKVFINASKPPKEAKKWDE